MGCPGSGKGLDLGACAEVQGNEPQGLPDEVLEGKLLELIVLDHEDAHRLAVPPVVGLCAKKTHNRIVHWSALGEERADWQ